MQLFKLDITSKKPTNFELVSMLMLNPTSHGFAMVYYSNIFIGYMMVLFCK